MKLVQQFIVTSREVAVDSLSLATSLSKSAMKDCLTKGGVWLKRGGKKQRRIRKAKMMLLPGDRLAVYFDSDILSQPVPEPRRIFFTHQYSIWDKPAGLLSQGTHFGDHCSLLRVVEKMERKPVYPIHRLDREARGLLLVAHTSEAAARLSELFRQGKVEKRYRAIVRGRLDDPGKEFQITEPLDGKAAATTILVRRYDSKQDITEIDIQLHTGRYHQIRRHLSARGFPLMGDSRYGGRKTGEQLELTAYLLAFSCPFSGVQHRLSLD